MKLDGRYPVGCRTRLTADFFSALTTAVPGMYFLIQMVLLMAATGAVAASSVSEQVAGIISKMKAAYEQIDAYQTDTEVRMFKDGRLDETQRFLYTFRKPRHIRIDMEYPHSGAVLVYPDDEGKVVAKPGGWAGFLRLHLAPDSIFFRTAAGQRIDQTTMGLLIQNISLSLTEKRRGDSRVSEQNSRIFIEVLAEDHFIAGVLTLYRFSIDTVLWLPVGVRESTPEGILKREVVFRNLKILNNIPENFFRIEERSTGHGQTDR